MNVMPDWNHVWIRAAEAELSRKPMIQQSVKFVYAVISV